MEGMDDELLEIGRFSVVSGLSVPALRHYDDVGVLKPTEVDPRTSYRRYHPSQVAQARMICSLRGVDLPIDDIRDVLAAADESQVRSVLLRHQARLAERAERLDQVRAAVARGAQTAYDVVETVYADVPRSVWPAAEQSVQAQLEYLRTHP